MREILIATHNQSKPKEKMRINHSTFHFVADWKSGEPRPLEGECDEWQWFDWSELPEPLFKPAQDIVHLGINPLECKG